MLHLPFASTRRLCLLLAACLVVVLVLSGCVAPAAPPASSPTTPPLTTSPALAELVVQAPPRSVLQRVLARGALNCGVDEELPGFSRREPGADGSNTFVGFDADFCRVVAAAIFGDPTGKVVYFPLSFGERFTALQTGKVDVLFGNTSWIASLDAGLPLDFGPTTFYDSLGVLSDVDLPIRGPEELTRLNGRTVCIEDTGPAEADLVQLFADNGVTINTLLLKPNDYGYSAFISGKCDAVVTFQGRLYAKRSAFAGGDARRYPITQVAFVDGVDGSSRRLLVREPLGPVFIEGDSQWRDVVSWAVFATIQAEEYGLTAATIDNELERAQTPYEVFLGRRGAIGPNLGLKAEFAVNVVRYVGSYGEIYERNLSAIIPERGPNKVWNRGAGGVLSAPPFR